MSVLTVTGNPIPDPTLTYDYTRASTASHPSRTPLSAPSVTPRAFTSPDRKSYAVTSTGQVPPARATVNHHHHSRSISSTNLPHSPAHTSAPAPNTRQGAAHSRPQSSSHSRQSSNSHIMSMNRNSTTASATSSGPRRSTSGRSIATNGSASYVTLMRKQKATVWCDRAQNIDPRMAAAQKAARHRAAMEVQGSNSAGRTSTINSGGVVGKIRHGGVPKAPGYVPANMNGASVPLRLSANEMLGDDEETQSLGDNPMRGKRDGSGKSSTNSAKYRSGYPRPDQGRFSSTGTPPNGEGSPGQGIPEVSETPNEPQSEKRDYFDMDKSTRADSEDSFGELKEMAGPNSKQQALDKAKNADDLRRRGSVDERAMSMGTGVRLFVANPDLDD